jgi:lysozyme family protein
MSGSVDNFPDYILPILDMEGGSTYTDNPDDPGLCTIYGITQTTALAAGYSGDLAAMCQDDAIAIYRTLYWETPGFDQIDPIMPELAQYMLEIGINMGPAWPSEFLQRGLNVMNDRAMLYPTVHVDGRCGPLTRSALVSYLAVRPVSQAGGAVLMGVMRALAVERYIGIAERSPVMAMFEYGWLRNRALGV